MKKTIFYFFIIISMFFSTCENNVENNPIIPDLVKIYLYQTTSKYDSYCLDIYNVSNGYLIIGLHSDTQSEFDKESALFLQKTDLNGNTVWQKEIDDYNGYFSNSIKKENELHLILNKNQGIWHLKITSDDNFSTIPTYNFTEIELPYLYNEKYSCRLLNAEDTAYIFMGVGNYNQSDSVYNTVFISQLDNNFNFAKTISQQEFDPGMLEFKDDNLTLLKQFNHFFQLKKNKNEYLFNAPFKHNFALKQIGEFTPIFIDSTYIISNFQYSNQKLKAIISQINGNSQSYFVELPNIQPTKRSFDSLTTKMDIYNISSSSKIFIYEYSDFLFIAGTAQSGQIILYVQKGQSEFYEFYIGQYYEYQLSTIKVLNDKLILCGTTEVEYAYQRVFLITIPLKEFTEEYY